MLRSLGEGARLLISIGVGEGGVLVNEIIMPQKSDASFKANNE
jgi:hypothetical protein